MSRFPSGLHREKRRRCPRTEGENAGAADVHMTDEKVKEIDIELEMMEMSEVFGGSPIKNNYSIVELLKNVNAMAL